MAKINKASKPLQFSHVSQRTLYLARGLQIFLLLSGLFQTFFGETTIGVLTLVSLAAILMPEIVLRRPLVIPIEIQFILSLMVLFQFVIGEAWDFYTNTRFPHYDKFVHFMLPMFLSLIGFMIVYSAFIAGRLLATKVSMFWLVLGITLGVGAFWEILEYASDEIIYPRVEGWHHFQGSQTEDALHDTMNDLIVDMLGGIAGGLFAIYYIGKAESQKSPRFNYLMEEISAIKLG